MNRITTCEVLFYPFHLCHARTLYRLLAGFRRVHFRDYMAIQLSPFAGTTAYSDRMGDTHPDLLADGRLVQGYTVSGPLSPQCASAVDRDLADPIWRGLFHTALAYDRRFHIGLFGAPSSDATPDCKIDDALKSHRWTVDAVRQMSNTPVYGEDLQTFDYGFALLKTSAALVYTLQLASRHQWAVATDSPAHGALLHHMTLRDGLTLENHVIERAGY